MKEIKEFEKWFLQLPDVQEGSNIGEPYYMMETNNTPLIGIFISVAFYNDEQAIIISSNGKNKYYIANRIEESTKDYSTDGKYMHSFRVDNLFWFFEERIQGNSHSTCSIGFNMQMPFLSQQNWRDYYNANIANRPQNNMNEVITKENVDYSRIYLYTDVSGFQTFYKNRKIDNTHVKNLKKDMLEEGTKFVPPITVDINSYIKVDGQHRSIAYMELPEEFRKNNPLKVEFIDAPEDEAEMLKLIVNLNVKSKHWALKDFINSGNTEGSPINKLIDFCNDSNRPLLHVTHKNGTVSPKYRYGTAITIGKNDKKNITENSTVNISDEDFEMGALYYIEAEQLVHTLGLSNRIGAWLESFFQAWYNIRKDPAYSEMIDNIGMEAICNALTPSEFTTNKKEQWEATFKSLIWRVNSRR